MLSNKKDQEIIVDSPPPRESMGQSSDSTLTLPYSHGQAVLPTSTSSPSVSSITSSPVSAPQNVTTEHFPLVFSSSSSLYHSSLQPSSISLPDPPPYLNTVLPTPLGSTLYGNPFSPIYAHTTPLFGSIPFVGSSFSFPQLAFSFQPTLNPWSFSHTIYNPQPVYATVGNTSHLLSSNISSSFFTLSKFVLPLPFVTPILLSQLFLTLLNPVQIVFEEGGSPGVGKGGGVKTTPIIPPGNLIPNPVFNTSLSSNIAFSSPNPPFSRHFRYICPDGPINLSTKPKVTNYTPEGALANPFLKSDLSQPKIFSPMVTFNEPSEHVRDMFTIVYSCNFLPAGDHKLTLFIHIKK